MSMSSLSLFMDIMILAGLAATIYFALRLSKSLASFRAQRKEFEKMMKDLNQNIEKAHRSLLEIKGFSAVDDETFTVGEARQLLEELKIMHRSGNNLADRLEKAASQKGGARIGEESAHDYDEQLYGTIAALETHSRRSAERDEEERGFAIHDREFEMANAPSKAEQELMQALKKNKKSRAG